MLQGAFNMTPKRFQLKIKCECGYEWDANTNMKYYVNCPDCRKMVSIGHLTGVEKI